MMGAHQLTHTWGTDMARAILLEPSKTYAHRETLDRAIAKLQAQGLIGEQDRFLICFDFDGRMYPVFLYNERTSTFSPANLAQAGFCSAC